MISRAARRSLFVPIDAERVRDRFYEILMKATGKPEPRPPAPVRKTIRRVPPPVVTPRKQSIAYWSESRVRST
jgi:hypothetical protein